MPSKKRSLITGGIFFLFVVISTIHISLRTKKQDHPEGSPDNWYMEVACATIVLQVAVVLELFAYLTPVDHRAANTIDKHNRAAKTCIVDIYIGKHLR